MLPLAEVDLEGAGSGPLKWPPSLDAKVKVLVCGPPPMEKMIAGSKGPKGAQGELDGHLKALGYTAEQVCKF